MIRHLAILSAAAALGCGSPKESEFVGQTIGDYGATTTQGSTIGTTTPANAPDDFLGASTSSCGLETDLPELIATGGTGQIDVVHVAAFYGACCIEWGVSAEVLPATSEIVVAYTAGGQQTCDCDCNHTLGYTIDDLPPGGWTIYAAGLRASAATQ